MYIQTHTHAMYTGTPLVYWVRSYDWEGDTNQAGALGIAQLAKITPRTVRFMVDISVPNGSYSLVI